MSELQVGRHTVVAHWEDGHFWAEVPELPGAFACGETLHELRESVAEAIGLYLRGTDDC